MPSGFFPEYKQNAYMLFGRTNEKEQPGIPWERRVIRRGLDISAKCTIRPPWLKYFDTDNSNETEWESLELNPPTCEIHNE